MLLIQAAFGICANNFRTYKRMFVLCVYNIITNARVDMCVPRIMSLWLYLSILFGKMLPQHIGLRSVEHTAYTY